MKDCKLTIKINKPVSEVFEFTTNPNNTPLWVSSIVHEEVDGTPVKLGTLYKNKDQSGQWNEYEVTQFEKDKTFVFSSKTSSYHVKYTFTKIDENSCELEYYEWMDNGVLDNPFSMDPMFKLKEILES